MIDGAPQVDHLAIHFDVHFIKVPTPVATPAHVIDPLATNFTCQKRAKICSTTVVPSRGKDQSHARTTNPRRSATKAESEHTVAPLRRSARVSSGNAETDWRASPSICGSFQLTTSIRPDLPHPFDRTSSVGRNFSQCPRGPLSDGMWMAPR